MTSGAWWSEFFRGPTLELWKRAHTLEENKGEAADLVRALALEPGERVLDVPCGYGRIALELAARGLRVRGLDASEEYVAEARRRAVERRLPVDFTLGDMRALPWRNELDAVVCVGNSFGYFDDDGNRAFLAGVYAALVPGGRFFLSYPLVAELALAARGLRDWRRLGDTLLLSESWHDARRGRLETTYTAVELEARKPLEEKHASYRVYTRVELEELLRTTGFSELVCTLDEDEFTAIARR